MNQSEYALQWLKYHGGYERYAYKVFHKALKQSFASLPIDNITYDNYKFVIGLNVHEKPIFDAYYEVYKRIGLIHGRREGRAINKDIKEFELPFFNATFWGDMLKWMDEFAGQRITSVTETVAKRIGILVELAQRRNLSSFEMHKFLVASMDDPNFTKYQALRIARTEVGTAANFAAKTAASQSKYIMEKVWISIPDSRARRKPDDEWDHMKMNGVRVGENEPFVMTSKKGVVNQMDRSCDNNASPGNVINCRCKTVYVTKKDKDGRSIRRG